MASRFLHTVGEGLAYLALFHPIKVLYIDDFVFRYLGTDLFDDEIDIGLKVQNEPEKVHNLPFFLKEEELSEDELEKMLKERYKDGSKLVSYAEDDYETKRSVQRDAFVSSLKDPTMWKVKCMVQCLIKLRPEFGMP